MRPAMIGSFICASSCLALSGCTPFPYRSGAFEKSLSFGDVIQLRALVRNRPDIRQPICQIYAVAPDRVEVSSGPGCNTSGTHLTTGFTARKIHGNWVIDETSIEDERSIILIEPIGSN